MLCFLRLLKMEDISSPNIKSKKKNNLINFLNESHYILFNSKKLRCNPLQPNIICQISHKHQESWTWTRVKIYLVSSKNYLIILFRPFFFRTYKQPVAISSDGRYFVSRYISSNSRAFPHSTRKFQMAGMPSSPGPGTSISRQNIHLIYNMFFFVGAYRLPSEFGYYEAKSVAK